ncbi:MAG TPA: RNA ligase [Tepidisphaeraceae bacterium]|nr:RNA ligase [Tepidisphaeraceae bacterium]
MPLDPTLLKELLGRHPARRMAYDVLRKGLARGVEARDILVSRDAGLELYAYSSTCQFEQHWDLFSLIARGLILDPAERRVVATPFPKFFNFNEGGIMLPDEPFEATAKIDGSLGIVFHHRGQWRVTTRGQLTSGQGKWATDYLRGQVQCDALTPGVTYLAEIVYPENRIVIPYDFAGLVLLGAYDEAGDELPRPALQAVAQAAGLRITQAIAGSSFEQLLAIAGQLTRDEEGFVIRFQSGLRTKLKGEAYCRVHRLICNCTPLALWDAMMNVQDLDAMRPDLPEEMRGDFDTIRRLLEARFAGLIEQVRTAHEQTRHANDKELGLIIQDPAAPLSDVQRKFLFACRKQNFLAAALLPGEWRQKAFRLIRPGGNRLPGYTPSNVMSRFEAESGS